MKLAFADPPYFGCCKMYDHHHPDGRCWDDLDTHAELFRRLEADYDGWAYCLTSTSLRAILPLVPPFVRVAAWVKPFAAYKANVRIAYTWEPVLFVPARDRSSDGAPVGRDHLAEGITLRKGLTGAKPPRFCSWVLDLLGYVDGDELVDLYPGTGVMGRTAGQGRLTFCPPGDEIVLARIEELEEERQMVLTAINLYGDEVLHQALDDIGWVPRPPHNGEPPIATNPPKNDGSGVQS